MSQLTIGSLFAKGLKGALAGDNFASFEPPLRRFFDWFPADKATVIGVLGPQGAGKTSLCRHLCGVLRGVGFGAESVSLDDFYLSFEERRAAGIKWRGPPGTHDVTLMLESVRAAKKPSVSQLALPVFDKLLEGGQGDRLQPRTVARPNLLLLEGWFVGLRPVPTVHSPSNSKLAEYTPVWDELDGLLVLEPQDFGFSYKWRQEAESQAGGGGMSEGQVVEFVDSFMSALSPRVYYPALREWLRGSGLRHEWLLLDSHHNCLAAI